MATLKEIYSLHRYYIWADRMRLHFDEYAIQDKHDPNWNLNTFLYMSYWYSALYVVIEGWRELNLNDSEVDHLLASPNVDLLRRYRNGTFHFQATYYDDRIVDFIKEEGIVLWIRRLNQALSAFFLKHFEQLSQ